MDAPAERPYCQCTHDYLLHIVLLITADNPIYSCHPSRWLTEQTGPSGVKRGAYLPQREATCEFSAPTSTERRNRSPYLCCGHSVSLPHHADCLPLLGQAFETSCAAKACAMGLQRDVKSPWVVNTGTTLVAYTHVYRPFVTQLFGNIFPAS